MTDAQARARANVRGMGILKFSHHLSHHLQSHRNRVGDAAAHVCYLSHAGFARKIISHEFSVSPDVNLSHQMLKGCAPVAASVPDFRKLLKVQSCLTCSV
jgi:hypothetical protein